MLVLVDVHGTPPTLLRARYFFCPPIGKRLGLGFHAAGEHERIYCTAADQFVSLIILCVFQGLRLPTNWSIRFH